MTTHVRLRQLAGVTSATALFLVPAPALADTDWGPARWVPAAAGHAMWRDAWDQVIATDGQRITVLLRRGPTIKQSELLTRRHTTAATTSTDGGRTWRTPPGAHHPLGGRTLPARGLPRRAPHRGGLAAPSQGHLEGARRHDHGLDEREQRSHLVGTGSTVGEERVRPLADRRRVGRRPEGGRRLGAEPAGGCPAGAQHGRWHVLPGCGPDLPRAASQAQAGRAHDVARRTSARRRLGAVVQPPGRRLRLGTRALQQRRRPELGRGPPARPDRVLPRLAGRCPVDRGVGRRPAGRHRVGRPGQQRAAAAVCPLDRRRAHLEHPRPRPVRPSTQRPERGNVRQRKRSDDRLACRGRRRGAGGCVRGHGGPVLRRGAHLAAPADPGAAGRTGGRGVRRRSAHKWCGATTAAVCRR